MAAAGGDAIAERVDLVARVVSARANHAHDPAEIRHAVERVGVEDDEVRVAAGLDRAHRVGPVEVVGDVGRSTIPIGDLAGTYEDCTAMAPSDGVVAGPGPNAT
jgi:hypothetical protein